LPVYHDSVRVAWVANLGHFTECVCLLQSYCSLIVPHPLIAWGVK
jgi:hypothetical protein